MRDDITRYRTCIYVYASASATIVNQTTDTQIIWSWSDIEPPYDIWLNGEKVVDNSTLVIIIHGGGRQPICITVIGNDTSETNTVQVIYQFTHIFHHQRMASRYALS